MTARRALIQWLESYRRSGMTSWKDIAPAAPASSPQSAESVPRAAESARHGSSSSSALAGGLPSSVLSPDVSSSAIVTRPAPSEPEMPKKKPLIPPPLRHFEPLDLPRAEREARLQALQTCVAGCLRCPELAATRTQTVFGVGNPEARILFIGEAPGADEDKQGEPFVGRAGQLLNDIITACRLERSEIYICNILRCRPPGNRLPSPQEAENCREYLDGQIAIVNPEYIVCWGACAARNLLDSEEAIGKMRGKFYTYGRAKVVCTYHPSYLLRNPAAKKDVWEDLKFLFRDMGIDLTAKKSK